MVTSKLDLRDKMLIYVATLNQLAWVLSCYFGQQLIILISILMDVLIMGCFAASLRENNSFIPSIISFLLMMVFGLTIGLAIEEDRLRAVTAQITISLMSILLWITAWLILRNNGLSIFDLRTTKRETDADSQASGSLRDTILLDESSQSHNDLYLESESEQPDLPAQFHLERMRVRDQRRSRVALLIWICVIKNLLTLALYIWLYIRLEEKAYEPWETFLIVTANLVGHLSVPIAVFFLIYLPQRGFISRQPDVHLSNRRGDKTPTSPHDEPSESDALQEQLRIKSPPRRSSTQLRRSEQLVGQGQGGQIELLECEEPTARRLTFL